MRCGLSLHTHTHVVSGGSFNFYRLPTNSLATRSLTSWGGKQTTYDDVGETQQQQTVIFHQHRQLTTSWPAEPVLLSYNTHTQEKGLERWGFSLADEKSCLASYNTLLTERPSTSRQIAKIDRKNKE
jgi:hypothetical protein